jgi:uncharacterized protein involved in copper resistance
MKRMSFASVLAVFVAMLLFVPASPALAQATPHDHAQQAQKAGTKTDQMKMGEMKMGEMKMGEMKMDGTMMDEMAKKKKANAERITALMATVKSATGEAKVAAMADVVAVLIEERAAMQEHCAGMMNMMKTMGH